MKKKYISLSLVFLTVILGVVAIFTAWRLQQMRSTAPEKSEAADVVTSCAITSFTITREGSPTPTPTATPTGSPTATPTSSPTASPTGSPTSSPTATPTSSPTPTATSTPNPTASPTVTPSGTSTPLAYSSATPGITTTHSSPVPNLPDSGIGTPVLAGIALSTLFILAALILAL